MSRYLFPALSLAALIWSAPGWAGNAPIGGGGSCSGMTITDPVASTQGQQQAFDDGLYTCTGSAWAAEALIVGGVDQSNAAPSCNSTNAGMVKYSSGVFYACNGSSFQAISTGPGPGVLISTQTASASASLQFSGSNWSSSYNTLFLNCAGLMLSNAGGATLVFQVGEGAGPTWETTAHYTGGWHAFEADNTGGGEWSGNTITASDLLAAGQNNYSTTVPASLKAYIDNVSSTTIYKQVHYSFNAFAVGDGWYEQQGSAYWNNDRNAITGLQIKPSAGNIASGTCSLYGMN
jgi:hypothetical protein